LLTVRTATKRNTTKYDLNNNLKNVFKIKLGQYYNKSFQDHIIIFIIFNISLLYFALQMLNKLYFRFLTKHIILLSLIH